MTYLLMYRVRKKLHGDEWWWHSLSESPKQIPSKPHLWMAHPFALSPGQDHADHSWVQDGGKSSRRYSTRALLLLLKYYWLLIVLFKMEGNPQGGTAHAYYYYCWNIIDYWLFCSRWREILKEVQHTFTIIIAEILLFIDCVAVK